MEAKNLKILVLKIGSSSLLTAKGKFNTRLLTALARDIKMMSGQNLRVLVVTSGAIALGARSLGRLEKDKTILEKQALAAVGQSLLMKEYQKIFSRQNLTVAQVLLTRGDFAGRGSYISARNTLTTLLDLGVVPVINENDTVAVDEIKVGDNDTLSALVAGLVNADFLGIATGVSGLCLRDEKTGKFGDVICQVKEITPEIYEMCAGKSSLGTGGMITKLKAAEIAAASGIPTKIFSSELIGKKEILKILLDAGVGTKFLPREDRLEARQRWIAHGLKPRGKITVDDGAAQVLTKSGKSLLPVGVREVAGNFHSGEAVSVVNLAGQEFARGLSNYSADEIQQIKGLKSSELEKKLGYKYSDEIIHRDNLVIL